MLPPVEITSANIWQQIEPGCSIIAACLPTYGNLFAGKSSIFTSYRSFFSLGSRFSPKNTDRGDGHHGAENLIRPSSDKSSTSGRHWQLLDKTADGHSVEISAQNKSIGHKEPQDLETGIEMNPYAIDVTEEFGSESRVIRQG